ncbi:hypothetical protein NE865_12398 [Phthorimaea operculella]|nr:hypothetical protein NE865_12398 [Phthorimaea operculella]
MQNDYVSHKHFLVVQLVFMVVWFVSQSQSVENALKWATVVARYIVYLLTSLGLQELCGLAFKPLFWQRISLSRLYQQNQLCWLTYGVSAALLLVTNQRVLAEDFPLLFAAFLVCQFLKTEQKAQPTINYGTGMACSFFEGYLKHIIPSDGKSDGFVEKIRKWENGQGVVFPVKKLLLVITKSLYCPPDLREFNKHDRPDLPRIEPCVDKSLEVVEKDVAGVKNRRYSNTTYVIKWDDNSHPPVYLAAECATPLHTLYGVLNNHQLYRELVNADKDLLVRDFVVQLQNILDRSPVTQNKCVLVFFDDSPGSTEYLPNVLLQKIEELEPDYRGIIDRHDAQQAEDENVPLEAPPRVLTPGTLNGN